MAVSPSTIVLGILTCVPFGLAIRDTVKDKPEPSVEPIDHETIDEAKYEAEAAAEARAYEEKRAAERRRDEIIEQLFDESAGTLGRQFRVLTGEPYSTLPETIFEGQTKLADEWAIDLHTELVDGVLHSITIEPRMDADTTREMCASMATWFDDNWGEPDSAQTNRKIWLYTTLHRRVVFLTIGSNCKVVAERTVPLDEWITKTPESIVPVWAIGQTPAKVASTLKLTSPTDGDTFQWRAPGLGASTGKTEIVAYVKGGKIAGLVAHASHSYGADAVAEHFATVFGEPTADDPTQWKTKPPLALEVSESRVSVSIGKVPE